jgi:diphosphomevalonate decarboxylase
MVTATACANIALIKYWGKRDVRDNIPAAGSLSLTLDALRTITTVELVEGSDRLTLDGKPADAKALGRISKFADLVRAASGRTERVAVTSENAFPTAAGLASSASAFAALALAISRAFGQELSPTELSILARRGSGSAARSIFGGFARMTAGDDAHAYPLDGIELELGAAIAVANAAEKEIGSTDGMEHTRRTSPYHAAWLETVNRDLDAAEAALRAKDIAGLAELVEGNCLAMHANAMAARPGILYFKASTLWAIEEVRRMRAEGTPVFFTIDAGPHVVAFAPPEHVKAVSTRLAKHPEVTEVITSAAGGGAHVVGT